MCFLRSPQGVLVLSVLSLHASWFHVSERNDYKALLMGQGALTTGSGDSRYSKSKEGAATR